MFGIGRFGHTSLEYPVQEPSSGLRDAEDPIPIAGDIQSIEIIACFPSSVPPLAGDSLRSPDVIEPMHLAAIRERDRLTITAFRGPDNGRDGARLAQQAERAKKINRAARGGRPCHLNWSVPASTGVFGEIRFNQFSPLHAPEALLKGLKLRCIPAHINACTDPVLFRPFLQVSLESSRTRS